MAAEASTSPRKSSASPRSLAYATAACCRRDRGNIAWHSERRDRDAPVHQMNGRVTQNAVNGLTRASSKTSRSEDGQAQQQDHGEREPGERPDGPVVGEHAADQRIAHVTRGGRRARCRPRGTRARPPPPHEHRPIVPDRAGALPGPGQRRPAKGSAAEGAPQYQRRDGARDRDRGQRHARDGCGRPSPRQEPGDCQDVGERRTVGSNPARGSTRRQPRTTRSPPRTGRTVRCDSRAAQQADRAWPARTRPRRRRRTPGAVLAEIRGASRRTRTSRPPSSLDRRRARTRRRRSTRPPTAAPGRSAAAKKSRRTAIGANTRHLDDRQRPDEQVERAPPSHQSLPSSTRIGKSP